MSEPSDSSRVLKPWHPRFGMRAILLLMLVTCAMAANANRFVSLLTRANRSDYFIFIVFTLLTPMLVMVIMSLLRSLTRTRK